MYTLIYEIYFSLMRIYKIKNLRIIKRVIDYIEAYYNLYVYKKYKNDGLKKSGVTVTKRAQEIIISMTSYPGRIGTVWLTIETLLRQTVKPDKIILWLSNDQFTDIKQLPVELIEQQKRGLEIRFCDGDLKSHKKYYYVMKEFPDSIIILVDDDMFYPYKLVENLLKLHQKFPKDVCSMTTQRIFPDIDSAPINWRNPLPYEKIENSASVQIFTGSGSLYPPNSLLPEALNKEKFMEICPSADDLWLTFMVLAKETRITSFNRWHAFPINIYMTGKETLWHVNYLQGKNDEQWEALKKEYPKHYELIRENYKNDNR